METILWIVASYTLGTLTVLWVRSVDEKKLRKLNDSLAEENKKLLEIVSEISTTIEYNSKSMVITALSTIIDEVQKSMPKEDPK
jgi:hypothetical protein